MKPAKIIVNTLNLAMYGLSVVEESLCYRASAYLDRLQQLLSQNIREAEKAERLAESNRIAYTKTIMSDQFGAHG